MAEIKAKKVLFKNRDGEYLLPYVGSELNNPFSLLDYKYSEYELNNISWLRSQGQYNSKAVYPAVYELLLKIYNGVETKAGVNVKLTTEEYTDYDFVLNTADETFRSPVKVKLASGKAVVGNGMALGLTDGTINAGAVGRAPATSINGIVGSATGSYGQVVGFNGFTGDTLSNTVALGITTDPTKSGIETSDSDLYLYFYVGETVQNANLINAGRIEETLATKVDVNSSWGFPSNRYIDLTLGASGTTYTAPANGYVYFSRTATAAGQYIILASNIAIKTTAASASQMLQAYLPIRKGEVFTLNYTAATAGVLRFVYAEGEV
jgi:hypothetical protein